MARRPYSRCLGESAVRSSGRPSRLCISNSGCEAPVYKAETIACRVYIGSIRWRRTITPFEMTSPNRRTRPAANFEPWLPGTSWFGKDSLNPFVLTRRFKPPHETSGERGVRDHSHGPDRLVQVCRLKYHGAPGGQRPAPTRDVSKILSVAAPCVCPTSRPWRHYCYDDLGDHDQG